MIINLKTNNFYKKMLTGLKDTDKLVLMNLNDEDLMAICSSCKYFNILCDEIFYKTKFQIKFPSTEKNEKTWKRNYLEMNYYMNKLNKFGKFEVKSVDIVKDYYTLLIKNIGIKFYKVIIDDEDEFIKVVIKGYIDLVDFLLENDPSKQSYLNNATYYAILNKQKEMCLYLISKGADDWEYFMTAAAEIGDKELIENFIKNGPNDWNEGMSAAAKCKDFNKAKELILFFEEKGANNWELSLLGAIQVNNNFLIHYLIEKGVKNWDECLITAARHGNEKLVSFFLNKPVSLYYEAENAAYENSHHELAKFIRFYVDYYR